MDMEIFLTTLQDILQRDDPVTPPMALAEMEEWDSLAFMAVIAFADREAGKRVTIAMLRDLHSVGDLHALLFS